MFYSIFLILTSVDFELIDTIAVGHPYEFYLYVRVPYYRYLSSVSRFSLILHQSRWLVGINWRAFWPLFYPSYTFLSFSVILHQVVVDRPPFVLHLPFWSHATKIPKCTLICFIVCGDNHIPPWLPLDFNSPPESILHAHSFFGVWVPAALEIHRNS